MHLVFVHNLIREKAFYIGLTTAFAAYLARAFAGGMFVPYALKDVSNGLYYDNRAEVVDGLWLLLAAALIFSASEWGFKPFWDGIARSIVAVKMRLVEGLRSSANNGDMIGRLVNDVDFVMWNVGGMVNTLVPNMLTAVVSEVTVLQMNNALGLLSLAGLPVYLAVLEYYVNRVEEARSVERRAYSESIHAAGEYLSGRGPAEAFKRSLRTWLGGIGKNILLDRVYWSLSLSLNYSVPLAVLILGVDYVRRDVINVGSLIGVLYAAMNMYGALTNAFWGICLMGQNRVPINRIMSIKEASDQRTGARGLLRP